MLSFRDRQVNSSRPVHLTEEMSYNNEAFTGEYETSRSAGLHGRQGLYIRKLSVPLPPSGFSGSEQRESSSRPLNDLLPILEMPEPLHGDLTASLQSNGRTRDKTSGKDATVKDKMLERVREGTETRTECFPTIKKEQHAERERTDGTSAAAASLVQGDAGGKPNTDKPRDENIKTNHIKKAKVTVRDADNPYRAILAVICVSDEDNTSTEDELQESF